MPNPARQHPPVKLTKSAIDRLKPGPKDQFVWDAMDKGFGAKMSPAGKVTFIVQGRLRPTAPAIRITVGAYGIFTPDEAREVAREQPRRLLRWCPKRLHFRLMRRIGLRVFHRLIPGQKVGDFRGGRGRCPNFLQEAAELIEQRRQRRIIGRQVDRETFWQFDPVKGKPF